MLGVGNVVLFELIDLGRRGKNKRRDGARSALEDHDHSCQQISLSASTSRVLNMFSVYRIYVALKHTAKGVALSSLNFMFATSVRLDGYWDLRNGEFSWPTTARINI